jgi:hypothetical protein
MLSSSQLCGDCLSSSLMSSKYEEPGRGFSRRTDQPVLALSSNAFFEVLGPLEPFVQHDIEGRASTDLLFANKRSERLDIFLQGRV